MRKIIITEKPVYCKISQQDLKFFRKLTLPKTIYLTQKKETRIIQQPIVNYLGYFLSGFMGRIKAFASERSLELAIESAPDLHKLRTAHYTPFPLPLRDYQIEAIDSALYYQRGVIQMPQASGKTRVMMAIAHRFPQTIIIILTHTKDLLYQTAKVAKEVFGDASIGIIGDGITNPSRITVATPQTMCKLKASEFHEKIAIVMVDEAHHVSTENGIFGRVLKSFPNASMRLGFTATLPHTHEGKRALEGLIGPTLYSMRSHILSDKEVLAKLHIKFIKIEPNLTLKKIRKYSVVYEYCIVKNRTRNRRICEEANELTSKGQTVLILVNQTTHGEILRNTFSVLYPNLKVEYMWSHINSTTRQETISLLNDAKIDVVIATTVWKEGVNIPNLGAVINAAGGKSEIACLQLIGRALRRTPEKTDAIIVDFFDPSHYYLIDHFGERLCLYFDEGWMK